MAATLLRVVLCLALAAAASCQKPLSKILDICNHLECIADIS